MPYANPEDRKAYLKSYYARFKDNKRKYDSDYYATNKSKGWNKSLLTETEEHRATRLSAMRDYMLRRNFGITADEYAQMLIAQDGKCALCLKPPSDKPGRHGTPVGLAVDHCHASGRVRKLLCANCNMKLGWFEKNRTAVEAYLAFTGEVR